MQFSKRYTQFLILPAALSLLALVAILLWGLKPGIDLAGGSLVQISFPNGRPDIAQVESMVAKLNVGQSRVQPASTKSRACYGLQ